MSITLSDLHLNHCYCDQEFVLGKSKKKRKKKKKKRNEKKMHIKHNNGSSTTFAVTKPYRSN